MHTNCEYSFDLLKSMISIYDYVTLITTGEYLQNRCIMGSHTCTPCQERLPSCVLLLDGRHIYPGRMWQSDFIVCYKHRTTVERCENGIFNPVILRCEMHSTYTHSPTVTPTIPTTTPATNIVPTTSIKPESKKTKRYNCWVGNVVLTFCMIFTISKTIKEDCYQYQIHTSYIFDESNRFLNSQQNWLIYDKTGLGILSKLVTKS